MERTPSVDHRVAFLLEAEELLKAYENSTFVTFYHDHRHLLGYCLRDSADLQTCHAAGVDFMTGYTSATREIRQAFVTFFGLPQDLLILQSGELTSTAQETVSRIRCFRERVANTWDVGTIGCHDSYPLVSVRFELWIGRRTLGPAVHDSFRAFASNITSLERTSPRSRPLRKEFRHIPEPPRPLEVRSYDSFLDHARLIALKSNPFPQQDLLIRILHETTDNHVIARGLDRLDRKKENSGIFEEYLDSDDRWVRAAAIAGTENARRLEHLLQHCQTDDERELLQTRLNVLCGRTADLLAIVQRDAFFLAIEQAVGGIDHPGTLSDCLASLTPDNYANQQKRQLVEAQIAYLNADLDSLDALLVSSSGSNHDFVLRLKNQLCQPSSRHPVAFVSYKRESEEHNNWVKMLASDLRAKGVDVVLDEWDLRLGDSISEFMATEILRCDCMVLVITEAVVAVAEGNSKEGQGVRYELQMANARRLRGDNFRIIGVLRSGHRPPAQIADNLYVDFRFDSIYEYNVNKLADSILERTERPSLGNSREGSGSER